MARRRTPRAPAAPRRPTAHRPDPADGAAAGPDAKSVAGRRIRLGADVA